jgi:hypothetical protein
MGLLALCRILAQAPPIKNNQGKGKGKGGLKVMKRNSNVRQKEN